MSRLEEKSVSGFISRLGVFLLVKVFFLAGLLCGLIVR